MRVTGTIACVGTAALILAGALASAQMKQPMLGQGAPGFSLPSLEGKTVSLAGFRGQLVVLHFGAGW